MTLMFTEGHRFTGNYNLCSHSVAKLHEVTEMFVMVDYVREMVEKKSWKYCEYRSFEHLLVLYEIHV